MAKAYLIYEGESIVGEENKKREKLVSCRLKEEEAKDYLAKWAAQMDAQIDILDWRRIPSSSPDYGQIVYETYNQESWCRYAPHEYDEKAL